MDLDEAIRYHPWPYEALELEVTKAQASARSSDDLFQVSCLKQDLRDHWDRRLKEWNRNVEATRLLDVRG